MVSVLHHPRQMIASPYLQINEGIVTRGESKLLHLDPPFAPEEAYHATGTKYPKFFKMDALCKWAWVGAELLLNENGRLRYEGIDKSRIAVVLATNHGCIDTDIRYAETMANIPSPALFVYTLPNIMHGEICIRHGFGGEQLCLAQETFDEAELRFWCGDLMKRGNTDACLAGWVDVSKGKPDVRLFWIEDKPANA